MTLRKKPNRAVRLGMMGMEWPWRASLRSWHLCLFLKEEQELVIYRSGGEKGACRVQGGIERHGGQGEVISSPLAPCGGLHLIHCEMSRRWCDRFVGSTGLTEWKTGEIRDGKREGEYTCIPEVSLKIREGNHS